MAFFQNKVKVFKMSKSSCKKVKQKEPKGQRNSRKTNER